MQRGDERICRIRAAKIGGGELLEIGLLNQRIGLGLGLEALSRHLKINPRRDEPCAAWQVLIGVPQGGEKRQRKTAPRAVSRNGDVLGQYALRKKKVIGRAGILKRGRKWVFRCEPVPDGQCSHARRPSGLHDHAAMADDRARYVTAAVKIEKNARGIAARRQGPLHGNGSGVPCLDGNIGSDWMNGADGIEALSPLAQSHWSRLRA